MKYLLLTLVLITGIITFGMLNPYAVKSWSNKHLGTLYRLDGYPEFFIKMNPRLTPEDAKKLTAFVKDGDWAGYNAFIEANYPPQTCLPDGTCMPKTEFDKKYPDGLSWPVKQSDGTWKSSTEAEFNKATPHEESY